MRKVVAVAVMAALTGCATGYATKGFKGGFSETMIGERSYVIDFAGNGFTTPERAADFTLLRAAEKAIELGCTHFAQRGGRELVTAGGGIFKPQRRATFECYPDEQSAPVGGENMILDAKFIQQSIRDKYELGAAAK